MIPATPRCLAESEPAGTSELGGELTYSWSCRRRPELIAGTYRFLVALRRVHDLLLYAKHLFVAARLCGATSSWGRSEETDKSRAAGRSMQSGAALGYGVSQQAFKHAAGRRIGGVMPARITPSIKIPIDGAGFSD